MTGIRLLSVAFLLCACAGEPAGSEDAPVVFLTQDAVQTETMQALFQGRVVTDSAGCLRLDSPDNATVVWPKGFTLDTRRVLDDDGRLIGEIGDRFHLGGGEIPMLSGFSAALREKAERCPGNYWIVGEAGSSTD